MFNGLKPSDFVQKIDGIAVFLGNTGDGITEQHHYKKRALDLALQGICKGEELIGMEHSEWPATYENPVITMILQRVLETLKVRRRTRNTDHARFMERQATDDANSQAPGAKCNAGQIGDEIEEISTKDILKKNDEKLEVMGIIPSNTKARPRPFFHSSQMLPRGTKKKSSILCPKEES